MKLDPPYSAISEANCGDPFQLSPASRTKLLSQPRNLANRTAGGNSFDLRDFADDFKVHRPASCQLSDQTNKVSPPKIRIYCSNSLQLFTGNLKYSVFVSILYLLSFFIMIGTIKLEEIYWLI